MVTGALRRLSAGWGTRISVAVSALAVGCSAQTAGAPVGTVRVLAGPPGGGFRPLTAELVRQYALAFPEIGFALVERSTTETALEQIEGKEADLAMVLADTFYAPSATAHASQRFEPIRA